jgi:hypothetical protein
MLDFSSRVSHGSCKRKQEGSTSMSRSLGGRNIAAARRLYRGYSELMYLSKQLTHQDTCNPHLLAHRLINRLRYTEKVGVSAVAQLLETSIILTKQCTGSAKFESPASTYTMPYSLKGRNVLVTGGSR